MEFQNTKLLFNLTYIILYKISNRNKIYKKIPTGTYLFVFKNSKSILFPVLGRT